MPDDEPIVGDHCQAPDVLCIYPEAGFSPTIDLVESDILPDEYRDEARELAEYWKPFGLQDKCTPYYTQEELDLSAPFGIVETPAFMTNFTSALPPYMTVLEDGLEKRIKGGEEQIEKAFGQLRAYPWNGEKNLPLLDKVDVWRAMIIAGKAVIKWARRYSRLEKIAAENFVDDAQRRKEILEISDICWRIPAEPARGFRDAMQSKWFCFEICHSIERVSSGYGHLEDRLMWPCYKTSVIDRTFQPMTREEAVELVECERLKVSERGIAKGRMMRRGHLRIE